MYEVSLKVFQGFQAEADFVEALGEGDRKAPYAPISAFREFFEKIRDVSVPQHVDKKFLQKLRIASNNEWALLSALKFLGIVDDRGVPTHSYRLLQSTDRFQETLRHLVQTAYRPLFDVGGSTMSGDDLVNYFRLNSSPSQARNAARFFREVCRMAGVVSPSPEMGSEKFTSAERQTPALNAKAEAEADQLVAVLDMADAKMVLLQRLPPARSDWSADDYLKILDRFVELMRGIDRD